MLRSSLEKKSKYPEIELSQSFSLDNYFFSRPISIKIILNLFDTIKPIL